MLGTYYYHEIIRKTIVAFGTLFNNIHIKHSSDDGNTVSDIEVPLAYAPQQKFLAKLEQQAQLSKPIAMTMPRMSFEMTGISYDPSRKSNVTKTFKALDGEELKKVYLPVPYNINFELSIYSKLNDDALQIIEQILPYFQPSFKITIDLISAIGEKRDVPISLNNITMSDNYEGNFETRRALIYTLNFTANTYLFGPIADSTEGLIRKVQVDYYSSTDVQNAKREVRYTAVPNPIDADPGDDFGFTETYEYFADGKNYSVAQGQDL